MTPHTVIREATVRDAQGIARVHVDTWWTAYSGILPPEVLGSRTYQQREELWRTTLGRPGSEYVYVAESQGGVIGFASGGPERSGDPSFRGELYAIYIDAAHQHRGLGRALVGAIANRLARDGTRSLLVWVLAANAARDFYARLGAEVIRQQPIQIGAVTVDEVAYGWGDISGLLAPI